VKRGYQYQGPSVLAAFQSPPLKNPIKSSQEHRVRRTYGDSTAADFCEVEQRSKTQFDRDQVLLAARSTTFIFLI
jgi:hypothetical protein